MTLIFTDHARSTKKGNVLRSVCTSVHEREGVHPDQACLWGEGGYILTGTRSYPTRSCLGQRVP